MLSDVFGARRAPTADTTRKYKIRKYNTHNAKKVDRPEASALPHALPQQPASQVVVATAIPAAHVERPRVDRPVHEVRQCVVLKDHEAAAAGHPRVGA